MIGVLGQAATLTGFLAAIAGIGASVLAMRGRMPVAYAVRLAAVAAVAMVGANVAMVVALVNHDFSIGYVAQVGSLSTPLLYTMASLWGALEGSILFWSGLLAALLLLLGVRARGRDRDELPAALGVLFALLAFFTFIVLIAGSPWTPVSPVPADGPGPNPLLANHPLMAIHPPLLYLGFVGLSVPFALTVAALLKGDLGDAWLTNTRRWTLLPWASLSAGLILGAWWAYAVLGWGGYWAWDPVENMALVPWLTTTAFLHSAMVTKRRGILRGWNVALVVASFALTILATLVTRSGVLNSVHAFTQSPIGPLFLVLFGTITVGSVTLVALRLPAGAGEEPGAGNKGHGLSAEQPAVCRDRRDGALRHLVPSPRGGVRGRTGQRWCPVLRAGRRSPCGRLARARRDRADAALGRLVASLAGEADPGSGGGGRWGDPSRDGGWQPGRHRRRRGGRVRPRGVDLATCTSDQSAPAVRRPDPGWPSLDGWPDRPCRLRRHRIGRPRIVDRPN